MIDQEQAYQSLLAKVIYLIVQQNPDLRELVKEKFDIEVKPEFSKEQWRLDNKEHIREYSAKYYQKNKKRLRERQKEYEKKNRKKINAYKLEYYHKNKDDKRIR